MFPASWVVAEETHGVQHLSTPAFSSLEAAPARTLHAPFSSSVDRIGQPSGYAYLESASSEGSINSHGPCCQPSAPLSAPGWACCMPSPPSFRRANAFPPLPSNPGVASCLAVVLRNLFSRSVTVSPGDISDSATSRRYEHRYICSTL